MTEMTLSVLAVAQQQAPQDVGKAGPFGLLLLVPAVLLFAAQQRVQAATAGRFTTVGGRGPDGMQLPYITRCYRAVVKHLAPPPEVDVGGNAPGDDADATQVLHASIRSLRVAVSLRRGSQHWEIRSRLRIRVRGPDRDGRA